MRSPRLWLHGLLFSVVLHVVWIALEVAAGMFQTVSYTPDVINQYASVDYLQSQVSFGVISRPDWLWTTIEFAIPVVLYVLFQRLTAARRSRA